MLATPKVKGISCLQANSVNDLKSVGRALSVENKDDNKLNNTFWTHATNVSLQTFFWSYILVLISFNLNKTFTRELPVHVGNSVSDLVKRRVDYCFHSFVPTVYSQILLHIKC